MYKNLSDLEIPPEDANLWRYMDFTKFVSLLDKQALFFARGDLLDDPFEGRFPRANAAVRPQWFGRQITEEEMRAYLDIFKNSRQSTLLNCWHENDYESAAMWKLYAKDSAGIAIRTNFSDFTSSLIDGQDIYVGRVKYIDYDSTVVPESTVIDPFWYKRPSFSHEREVRAIIRSAAHYLLGDDPALRIVDSGTFSFMGYGEYSRVNLSVLVHEVVISPYADDWFQELVESVIRRYDLAIPVRMSSLAEKPTWE